MSGREGNPTHKELEKHLQDLLWGIFKKAKLKKKIIDTLTQENLQNLEKTLI